MKEIEMWLNDLKILHGFLTQNSLDLSDDQRKFIWDKIKDLNEKYKPKCQRCYGAGIIYGQYLCRDCVVFK